MSSMPSAKTWSSNMLMVNLRYENIMLMITWKCSSIQMIKSFDIMQIKSIILTFLTMQIWRYEYLRHFNFVIFLGAVTFVDTLSIYTINQYVVSMFVDWSFFILAIFSLCCSIDVFYLFKWMNVINCFRKTIIIWQLSIYWKKELYWVSVL